jgi:ABC-type transporter Mla subunit MlaD
MPGNNSPAGSLSTTWQGLNQIPQLLNDVKTGVNTLQSLISTPAAAVATGSPPASAAIVMLGAELVVFLAQTMQAIEHDIQGIAQVAKNYKATEGDLAGLLGAGVGVLAGLNKPSAPELTTVSVRTPPFVPQGSPDGVRPVARTFSSSGAQR